MDEAVGQPLLELAEGRGIIQGQLARRRQVPQDTPTSRRGSTANSLVR
jgi:hypothetical protein